MAVPLSALIGLLGIVLGILALRTLERDLRRSGVVPAWKAARWCALSIGVLLAVGSWLGREWLSYSGNGPQAPGTVVGWPFFVAFRNAGEAGGITFLTFPLAVLNAAFWFLLPQLLLWLLPLRPRVLDAAISAREDR